MGSFIDESGFQVLNNALFNSPIPLIFFKDSIIVEANQAALDLFEVEDKSSFIGEDVKKFMPLGEPIDERARKRRDGVSESFETSIIAGGKEKVIQVAAVALKLPGITSFNILSDVSETTNLRKKILTSDAEYKKVYDTLMKVQERWTGFLESATDGFLIADEELRILEANPMWFGRARQTEDAVGRKLTEIFPNLVDSERVDKYRKVIETGNAIELGNILAPSGTGLHYNIKAFKVGSGLGLIVRDVTEQIRQEQHIEYIYQILLAIRNVNQLIVSEKDRDVLLQKSCDLMVETKGYNFCRVIYTDQKGNVIKLFDSDPDEILRLEYTDPSHYPCMDRWGTDTVTILDDPPEDCGECPFYSGASGYAVLGMRLSHSGKNYGYFTAAVPEGMTGREELDLFEEVVGDISYALHALDLEEERSKAERELEESENRYRNLLELGMDGVTVNVLGKLVYANPRFVEMIRYSREELFGLSVLDLHKPEYREMIEDRTRKRHNGIDVPSHYEVELVRKDGTIFPASYSVSRILFEGEYASLTYIRDISDKARYERNMEALVSHAAKLRALSTVEEIAEVTFEIMREVFDFDLGSFGIIEDNRVLHIQNTGSKGTVSHVIDEKGIINRAINTGESQLVKDVTVDVDYTMGLIDNGLEIRSELTVPIKRRNMVLGILNIEMKEVDGFSEEDKHLLELLAGHVSTTLQEFRYKEKIESLHKHSNELQKAGSIQEILDITNSALTATLGYTVRDIIGVMDKELVDVYTTTPEPYRTPIDGPGVTARAARLRETQLVSDTRDDPDYIIGTYEKRMMSELVVPILIGGETRFLLNVESEMLDAFNDEDVKLLETLATHVSTAISRLHNEQNLENTVRERTIELEEANERLVNLDQMKNRFISTATHELRTPLTVMKGYLDLARLEEMSETLRGYLEIAHRNTDRLETITHDLLDQQRIEEGRLELKKETIEVNSMIWDATADMEGILETNNQVLEINLPEKETRIQGDKTRLLQVLINLIDNASKYSPPGTTVKVSTIVSDDEIEIIVEDMGFGLKKTDIGKLFTPFPDIERPVNTARSVGLGLSISYGIINLHGGEITAESEGEGMGSKFRVRLPRA